MMSIRDQISETERRIFLNCYIEECAFENIKSPLIEGKMTALQDLIEELWLTDLYRLWKEEKEQGTEKKCGKKMR